MSLTRSEKVMPRHVFSLLLPLALTAMLACGGNSTQPPLPSATTDVYAAGFEENDAGLYVAKYWKNGKAVVLGDGVNGSYASSIAVSGGNVYASGVEKNGDHVVAKYWKNGVRVEITDGTLQSFSHSIFVAGNDIYVAGQEWEPGLTVARYWKNGVPVTLQDGQEAWSILVVGSDVYVAGNGYKFTQIDPTHRVGNRVAMYWKNGVPTELTDGLAPAVAYSIFVTPGGDVYVGGWACQTMDPGCAHAMYWKNDMPVQVSGVTDTDVVSIALSGADLYAAGNEANSIARLWKNGEPMHLTDGSRTSGANQLVVSGSDVYVAGGELNDANIGVAKYWKNGSPVSITDGTHFSSAYAITVVKH